MIVPLPGPLSATRNLVIAPHIEEVPVQPRSCYLVCATPRSGSTLLCEALINTGHAGVPREYFEALKDSGLPRRPREYFGDVDDAGILDLLGEYSTLDTLPKRYEHGEEYAHYLAHVFREGTTPNGVFGAKIMWGYLDDFLTHLRELEPYTDLPVPELLATVFHDPRYIFVTRDDKVRQAISLWKAIQNSAWSQEESSTAHATHDLVFHPGAIDHLLRRIIAHEGAWEAYFAGNGIRPFRVVYEQLVASYERTVLDILRWLNIDVSAGAAFKARRMKQQADALSEEWVQRFRALRGG
jgi:trehalose 2-sulfotransferase